MVSGLPPAELLVERLRLGLERELMRRLAREVAYLADCAPVPRDHEEVRREWFWASELLPEPQRARARRLAAITRIRLGVSRDVELFQKAGDGDHLNAATHRGTDGPILIQLHGDLLDRLDDRGVLALLGHEIGHHLAHGPNSAAGVDPFALYGLLARGRRAGHRELAAAYRRAAELTADRIGFLACRSVDAFTRMLVLLDHPSEAVEPDARLRSSREYVEELSRRRDRGLGDSHPEDAIRIYAIWLFAQSDEYRALTGLGPGTRPLAAIDRALSRLVAPAESAEDMGLPPETEPCLVDRARELVADARRRVEEHIKAALRRTRTASVAGDPADDVDLAELDRDPLEERFAALERQLEHG